MNRADDPFRAMIDALPTMSWGTGPDGSIEFLNQRWCNYTGLSIQEGRGWGWKTTIHSDDLPMLMQTWNTILASGEPGEIEARVRRFDGEYRWFLIRAEPSHESGQLIGWYGTN